MILTALALSAALAPCRSFDTRLPRPLSGWTRAGQGLDTGHSVVLPARRGEAATSVRIRKAGTFGIAIDQAGWIDIAPPRGRALRYTSEAKGPACSTISKIVRFRLQPGTYRVSASRLKGGRVKLMLVR
ncbi:hypothetical protein [Sphingomonas sp. M1-B02]|uniref:hypothetical protein n=1 Tax=Sphingomonas sp. M1-B02 TaxID=3114300 RepID=UPI00223F8139|nr:hypothetical protein [Sphingomonas sp. S6-11]UZK64707.1 hypothetical protein OKW87_09145 [Sphingomonas sp. S6-11]